MKKSAKIILGICTFGYFVLVIIFVCTIIFQMLSNMPMTDDMNLHPNVLVRQYFQDILHLLPFAIIMGVCWLSLLIYYIVHVATLKTISTGERVMWILLFIFFKSITFIIYFFVRIVPQPEPDNTMHTIPS